MRPRVFTTIDEIPLVGGSLCLDFVNTTGNRAGAVPRERLGSYRDLIAFGRRKAVITAAEARELLIASNRKAARCETVLQEMIAFRESLYRLFLSALGARQPSNRDLAKFNGQYSQSVGDRRLGWVDGRPGWIPPAVSLELGILASQVVESASELLTSGKLELLRKCGECDWLFIDQTKNRGRRWCKKTCGDRVKARRYYARRAASQ